MWPPAIDIDNCSVLTRSPFDLNAVFVHSDIQPACALVGTAASNTSSIALWNIPPIPIFPPAKLPSESTSGGAQVNFAAASAEGARAADHRLGAVGFLAPHVDVDAAVSSLRQ